MRLGEERRENRRGQVLRHLRGEDRAETARGLVPEELHEVALDHVEALPSALPHGVGVAFDTPGLDARRAQEIEELAPATAEVDDGALPAKQLDVVGLSRADVLPRAPEAVLEGGVGRVRRRPRRRAGDLRGRGLRQEALPQRAHLLREDLEAVAQREEPLEAALHPVETSAEDLEDLLGPGRCPGHAHVVAGVDHGLDPLRVADQGLGHLAQARVVPRPVLEVGVQETDEDGVEPRLAVDHGRERVEGAAVERGAEAAPVGPRRRRPEAVQLPEEVADLGPRLLRHGEGGEPVERREGLGVGGFLVLEAAAQLQERGMLDLVGHGGLYCASCRRMQGLGSASRG